MTIAALRELLVRFFVGPLVRLGRRVEWPALARRVLPYVALFAGAMALSLFMVGSFVTPFDGIKVWGHDYKDCGQFTWNLWIVAEQLLDGESPLWTDRAFYPVGANLAQHTLASGFAPLTILVKLLSGSHPLYPIVAYNLAIWLSYALLLTFGYLALREAGFGFWAAVIPAVGYAFCGFYYRHWLHLNLMAGFCMPLLAYLLIRLYKRPTLGRGLVFGFFTGASVYFTEFSLSAVIAMTLLVLIALPIGSSRRGMLRVVRGLGPRGCALTVLIAAVVAAPLVWSFFGGDAIPPIQRDFDRLAANAAAFVVPAPEATSLYDELLTDLQSEVRAGINGAEVFLGYPFILCMALGLLRPRSAFTVVAFAVGLVFALLSMGTTLLYFESSTQIHLPYHWLRDVPPFDQNRAPVRFVAVAHFCFTFLAASGIQLVVVRLSRWGRIARDAAIAICAGLLIWTIAETRYTTDHLHEPFKPPPRYLLDRLVDGPVVQLPLNRFPCNHALMQTFHGRPITTACLARGTRSGSRICGQYKSALDQDGARFVEVLKEKGVTNVLVTGDLLAHELVALREMKGINIVELDPQPMRVVAEWGDSKSHSGRFWHKARKWRIRGGQSKVFDGKGKLTATRIDVLADFDDRYRVEMLDANRPIVTLWAEPVDWAVGGQWRFIDIPGSLQHREFDAVRISAVGGDGRYSVATVVVAE